MRYSIAIEPQIPECYYEWEDGVGEALPKILLVGGAGIIVTMVVFYAVFDSIEKTHLKRINAKLAENRPQ